MRESGLEDVAVEWREEQDGAADARRLTLGDGGQDGSLQEKYVLRVRVNGREYHPREGLEQGEALSFD